MFPHVGLFVAQDLVAGRESPAERPLAVRPGAGFSSAFRPDVILLDIGLPKLNGYEACRRIREHLWGDDVVLIALTGWGQEDDVRRSDEAGFDHHMVKPVNPNTLMKLLAGLQSARV
jgi:DNA-binding response OmpR family regulator